jgi:hypothetical protein
VPVPAVSFQDHQQSLFASNVKAVANQPSGLVRHHSEEPPWRRRLEEDRLITKEDVQCFKKATIPRAIYLAQVPSCANRFSL